ncbi:hydroxypyruvate isomerase family protein [Pelagicoccus mobilis]|uniref:TIM barrel protein n=1 Tax=Pelagicoccus mobilis TaxID=415221 RepID=A0A934VR52_9BACT|nr:TIM barrel protein [Pelagicoccus mobilis]MBK1879037.1 TIM barrel protein [Pelagicoccus mobilis]
MRKVGTPLYFSALAAVLFASFSFPASAKELKMSDVKTKFAANLVLWYGGKKVPVLEKIEKAHADGFDAIEFWGYRKVDVPAVAAKCKELDMKVIQFSAWGKSLTSGKNIDEFEEGIKDALQAAEVLGVKKMTVVGHSWAEGLSKEDQVANYTAALKRVAPLCEEAGVMIIIEPFNPVNHGHNLLNGSQLAVEICREVNSPMIKINWDFYHMQLTEGALITYLERGIDQVGYLQLADTPGRHQPGTGELNYKAILKAAYDLGYRGYVGVECRPKGTEKEAIQQLLENAY